jgi:N-acetylneuraminic acid mutarotase
MKTPLAGPNAMNRIRVFLIATSLLAATPRLFGDIILVSRLSDAEVFAEPPQSQTGFLPANLCSEAAFVFAMGVRAGASSMSSSSILINSPMEGLRVVGNGTASAETFRFAANASAKLIVLSFTLTEVSYPYSITGQLNGAKCSSFSCSMATAKLTGETGTIFERVGTTLSESGTLPPGNYTLSVDVHASTTAFNQTGSANSNANFTFALDGPMSTPTPTPAPTPVTRATNLSTRLLVGTGNGRGIGGFIITGNGPRHLLLRGIGPSLSGIIPNTLPDPSLTLNRLRCNSQNLTNNNWRDTQEAEIIATGRAPSSDLESAIVADLPPGAYTAILADTAGTTGLGLVEIYDLSTNQDSKLANISTRGNVRTGDDIMIAGFILGAASDEDSIVLRGIGPSLYGFLPDNLLADPRLELRDSNGQLIIGNDNWMDDPNQAAIIQAVGLAPNNNLESAIAATLMPGPYTALLSGTNNGTGLGLVEVYENPLTPAPSPTPAPVPTPTPTPCCADDSWRATTLNGVPMARSYPVSVWTGTEMIVWGGMLPLTIAVFDTGGRYNPETDSWTATSVVNVPDARVNSTAVWTGSEMIVWGGANYNQQTGGLSTGGRYDPVSDTWTATNLTNAPTARFRHTAVWTGTEMIVWGGGTDPYGTVFNTGARYNPVTDTWSPISTVNAPAARFQHTAVWTGSEMIVWGGSAPTNPMNTGGRYNPLTDSWASLSVVDAPSARTGHTMVWTGQEMIVWGGSDGANVLNTGARYDPNSNSWLATGIGPEGRTAHSAVWTGNEMIIWAGATASEDTIFGNGSRYNPDTDTWRSTNLNGAPRPRTGHAAVWSGHQMIVWGGFALAVTYPNPIHLVVNDGGRYFASPPPTPSPRLAERISIRPNRSRGEGGRAHH